MWRVPFQKRRCLVPADGFYEWQKLDPKTKKPFFYSMNNRAAVRARRSLGCMEGPEQQRVAAELCDHHNRAE